MARISDLRGGTRRTPPPHRRKFRRRGARGSGDSLRMQARAFFVPKLLAFATLVQLKYPPTLGGRIGYEEAVPSPRRRSFALCAALLIASTVLALPARSAELPAQPEKPDSRISVQFGLG